jgi:hypothetical protein
MKRYFTLLEAQSFLSRETDAPINTHDLLEAVKAEKFKLYFPIFGTFIVNPYDWANIYTLEAASPDRWNRFKNHSGVLTISAYLSPNFEDIWHLESLDGDESINRGAVPIERLRCHFFSVLSGYESKAYDGNCLYVDPIKDSVISHSGLDMGSASDEELFALASASEWDFPDFSYPVRNLLFAADEVFSEAKKRRESRMSQTTPADENAAHNSEQPVAFKDFHSDKLRALFSASLMWKNASQDDKTTYPKTTTIEAYLVKRGFSPSLASKGASIVRPEWADKGRPPEK